MILFFFFFEVKELKSSSGDSSASSSTSIGATSSTEVRKKLQYLFSCNLRVSFQVSRLRLLENGVC